MPTTISELLASAPDVDYEELNSWHRMNAKLMTADEDECLKILKCAMTNDKSPRVVSRIFNRYSRLRRLREQEELGIDEFLRDQRK